MGVVGDLWSIAKDIGTGVGRVAGKGLSWVGTTLKDNKGNIIEFAKTLFDGAFFRKKDDGGTEFTEFKVSMVAPSGFGKTTLLVTIMNDAGNGLDNPTAGLTLKYKDDDDKMRINEAMAAMNNAILAGKGFTRRVDAKLLGTSEVKKFNFYYHLAKGEDSIDQPFSIMDIPGGWINPENRSTDEMNAKWEDFKNHLHDSRLLFVPVDATLLMEATSKAEREAAVALLDVHNVGELIKEWAKYRKESDKSSVLIFVPIKCEKYRDKEQALINKMKDTYGSIASNVRGILPSVGTYCIPLESLGCVEFSRANWCTEKGSESFSPTFKMVGDGILKTRNANTLFAMMYHMAEEEIAETLARTKDKLAGTGALGQLSSKVKEMKNMVNTIESLLEPMRRSLREYGNIDRMGSYQIFW